MVHPRIIGLYTETRAPRLGMVFGSISLLVCLELQVALGFAGSAAGPGERAGSRRGPGFPAGPAVSSRGGHGFGGPTGLRLSLRPGQGPAALFGGGSSAYGLGTTGLGLRSQLWLVNRGLYYAPAGG